MENENGRVNFTEGRRHCGTDPLEHVIGGQSQKSSNNRINVNFHPVYFFLVF